MKDIEGFIADHQEEIYARYSEVFPEKITSDFLLEDVDDLPEFVESYMFPDLDDYTHTITLDKSCRDILANVITKDFPYVEIAKEYEMIGADAISVVTEPDYFKGDDDFLKEIKKIVKIPVLRKDFVVDEYMVYEAKLLGADAILLITGILDEITLMRCINLAHNLAMSALSEANTT